MTTMFATWITNIPTILGYSQSNAATLTTLPTEVVADIISNLPALSSGSQETNATLCALALTSRALQYEAERELYRTVKLCGEEDIKDVGAALDFSGACDGGGRTARLVRQLTVEGCIEDEACWDILSSTLRLVTKLQALIIVTSTPPPLSVLTNSNIVSTNLRALTVPFIPTRSLAAVLAAQTGITQLSLTTASTIPAECRGISDNMSLDEFIEILTAEILPSLTSLRTPCTSLAAALISNRPIEHLWAPLPPIPVAISLSPQHNTLFLAQPNIHDPKVASPTLPHIPEPIELFLASLEGSTRPFRTLHFILHSPLSSTDIEALSVFVAFVLAMNPNLTSLGVIPLSSLLPLLPPQATSHSHPIPTPHFPRLRTLILNHTPSPLTVLHLSEQIPSLRWVICAGFSRTVEYLCIPVNCGADEGARSMNEEDVLKIVGAGFGCA
ncbi:hypothetical protein BD410DRAFT_302723 [Rickenella mellea]|uniref:F-box domain-containing protein n=1 Tax=Rickenella mellea TaxID=50990 RepID=A0A4Y7Q3J8_9AGAM|nr:hypothetical protein BD410DRAFT_302723 [Rickenella mellea]